ncbi:hypothetical protein LOC00_10630, partial [Lactobacillus delbrueckii subsp. lactis]|nr:hypothetical protein [Lactobacillus delbrueckii subsp. lactis]
MNGEAARFAYDIVCPKKERHCDMTPEIRTLISGVIFMTKYTKEIKLAIYHEWVDDHRRGTYL